MPKYLKEILGENYMQELLEVHTPFPEDERRFYEKHGLELGKEGEPPIKFPRFPNMYSEAGKHNADHLFNGVTKVYDREKDRYGYSYGKDDEYYEEYDPSLNEGKYKDAVVKSAKSRAFKTSIDALNASTDSFEHTVKGFLKDKSLAFRNRAKELKRRAARMSKHRDYAAQRQKKLENMSDREISRLVRNKARSISLK